MQSKKILIVIIISLLLDIIFNYGNNILNKKDPILNKGILDLEYYNLSKHGNIKLKGEWECYKNKLISPIDLKKGNIQINKKYIENTKQFKVNNELDSYSTSTFRIKVINNHIDQMMALKIRNIIGAYKIWINNDLKLQRGVITRENYRPDIADYTIFYNEAEELEIVIQVATYNKNVQDAISSVYIGTSKNICTSILKNIIFNMMVISSLLIIAMCQIVMYIYGNKNKSILYLGQVCILLALRVLFIGESKILFNYITLDYYIYTIIVLTLQIVLLYITNQLLNNLYHKKSLKLLLVKIAYLIFTIIILKTSLQKVFIVQLTYLLSLIILLVHTILGTIKHYKTSDNKIFSLISVNIIIVTIISDLLYHKNIFDTGRFIKIFYIVCAFIYGIKIVKTRTQALMKVENMKNEIAKGKEELENTNYQLKILNKELEKQINKNTMELELSNKKLRKERLSKSNLIANISHDLKTPLTSIKGYIEAMRDDVIKDNDKRKKYLYIVSTKIDELEKLIKDLFKLTQLNVDNIEIEKKEVKICDLLRDVYMKYELDIKQKGIHYILNYKSYAVGSLKINIDKDRMMQAFSNIISNAIKYTQHGGKIIIKCKRYDKLNLLIMISDTGNGIPKECLPYVFERYYKVMKNQDTKISGNGLGLSIVKEIIEYHKGNIWVESELKIGTTFYIRLPII